MCPEDTYADNYGTIACTPCPIYTVSQTGSIQCHSMFPYNLYYCLNGSCHKYNYKNEFKFNSEEIRLLTGMKKGKGEWIIKNIFNDLDFEKQKLPVLYKFSSFNRKYRHNFIAYILVRDRNSPPLFYSNSLDSNNTYCHFLKNEKLECNLNPIVDYNFRLIKYKL